MIHYNIRPVDSRPLMWPVHATAGDAALDLYYNPKLPEEDRTLDAGETRPFALVLSRSGLAAKSGIFVANAPGLIDPGYEGEIMAILHNSSRRSKRFSAGDRIAQLLVLPFPETCPHYVLRRGPRLDGGLGSSG